MGTRSGEPTDVQAPAAQQPTGSQSARHTERIASDQPSSLARSALAFVAHCHAAQRRPRDGTAFIEHPLQVARLLREAGCSDVVVVAGLLHEVVEHTPVSVSELTTRFGKDVADLVQAVTVGTSVHSYCQRERLLREQVRSAGGDAALLFAADKIAKIRELPDLARRDRARFDATARGQHTHNRLERNHRIRLEHHHESLRMLEHVAPGHPLVKRLADELAMTPDHPSNPA